MPKKVNYVVRVSVARDTDPQGHVSMLIENLRYCGVVREHNTNAAVVFDIKAPHGVESADWAKRNAERMLTFGYNAVVAPEVM